jgi:dTDP-4-amino-4,6-dideoxygalactose transaminase
VVHFGGQSADVDALMDLAARRGIPLIEDAAHAHGGEWRGKKAGSFGLFSAFSFQASKNMTAGEGGIICTNDQALAETCDSLLWAGRRAGRPWYEFHQLGWNYRITEIQSAILRCQLQRLGAQVQQRMKNGEYLSEQLGTIEGIRPLARDPRTTRHGYHIYMFRYDEDRLGLPRALFIRALEAEGIPAFSGYTFPLYKNPMFLEKQFINGSFPLGTTYHEDMDYRRFEAECPVAERACRSEAVWLPQNIFLGPREDMDDIVTAVRKVLARKDELNGN